MSPKKEFRPSSTVLALPAAAHTGSPAPHSLTAWSLPANSKLPSLKFGDLLEGGGRAEKQKDRNT